MPDHDGAPPVLSEVAEQGARVDDAAGSTTGGQPTDERERETDRDDAGQRSLRDSIPIILASVIAPTTLLTAILYYFGWVVTNAQARVFGLDESALGYSTRDYLLRSTGAIFVPLGGALLLGLALVWGHIFLSDWLEREDRSRDVERIASALRVAAAATFLVGILGIIFQSSADPVLAPFAFTLAIPLWAYSTWLRRRVRHISSASQAMSALNITLVVLLTSLSLFWLIGNFADRVGSVRALRAAARLDQRPSVIVYSPTRLHITASGVYEAEFQDADSIERFRYTGLRLLFKANGKYFLVPDDWSTNGVTIVLPDVGDLRFEFVRAGAPVSPP